MIIFFFFFFFFSLSLSSRPMETRLERFRPLSIPLDPATSKSGFPRIIFRLIKLPESRREVRACDNRRELILQTDRVDRGMALNIFAFDKGTDLKTFGYCHFIFLFSSVSFFHSHFLHLLIYLFIVNI